MVNPFGQILTEDRIGHYLIGDLATASLPQALFARQLPLGEGMRGELAFQVPENAIDLKIIISFDIKEPSVTVLVTP